MTDSLRSGFVAVIGRPNVGKSTLINHFAGQKVSITSKKPQTTRNRIRAICTEPDRGQVVFVDTPGLIKKAGNKLGEFMIREAKSAMRDVDLILVLVEPDRKVGRGDQAIFDSLKNINLPVILCINKIDSISREELLPVIDTFSKAGRFDEIFPVCARSGDNCDSLMDSIFSFLPYGPMYFDEDALTDQPERAMVAELIREKSLHALSQEVPHGIAVSIESMKYRTNKKGVQICDINAVVICEKKSHKGIIIGKGGEMLKKIGANARYEIEKLLDTKVNLSLFVKTKENWRDKDILLQNFGYREENEQL